MFTPITLTIRFVSCGNYSNLGRLKSGFLLDATGTLTRITRAGTGFRML
jgi:hypothetical protein